MTRSLGRQEVCFEGKRVHVIGLGRLGTGRAVATVLASRGAEVIVSDEKSAAELTGEIEALRGADVVVQTGDAAYRHIESAHLIVTSPGVPLDIPPLLHARQSGAVVISEIEVAFLIARCPIVAVTGTKGKTTVTTLIGELLRDAGRHALVGGNIGSPLAAIADTARPEDLIVGEVSSFQLEGTERFRPRVAVLLNLVPDHLDRHPTMAAYAAAKARVLANQTPEDTAVVNRDDPAAWRLRKQTRARVMPYSLERPQPDGADVADGVLRVHGERVCPASSVRIRGRHNLGNVLAALAATRAIGTELDRAACTLQRFEAVEHRLEPVGSVAGVSYVNDSQATTPEAAIAALDAFEEHVFLIAGGRAKVHDFRRLGEAIRRRQASVILIGEAAKEIAAAASEAGATDISHAADLADAVRQAHRRARPGDVVILSPACASFDMFANMAERGAVFKQAVAELAGRGGTM